VTATYRIQFHTGLGFRAARDLTTYLDALGVSHVYASPYFEARPGSTHGYDIIDPGRLDPSLGTEAEYASWMTRLAEHQMGHIVDFVPNHVAASPENRWWCDVLEEGKHSRFAHFFDIEWRPPKESLRDRVLLPVLARPYGESLERGELRVFRVGGAFHVRVGTSAFPLEPSTTAPIVARALERLSLPSEDPVRQELESIVLGLARLQAETQVERDVEKAVLKRRLAAAAESEPRFEAALDAELERLCGEAGEPTSFDALDELLMRQSYRLACWRVASEEINYRRFFDISDLASIRMEDEDVFFEMHALVRTLVRSGFVHGLRIDHIDGLYDPAHYLEKLRRTLEPICPGEAPWIVVEKILSPSESLSDSWPVSGTTGYEYLVAATGLFVDPSAEPTLTRLYQDTTGDRATFADHVLSAKRLIVRSALASELHMLSLFLERLAERHRRSRDFTLSVLRRALAETLCAFDVYRTYVRPDGSSQPEDTARITRAIRRATRRHPEISPAVFMFLRHAMLGEPSGADDPEHVQFAMRVQQMTGPLMAKGVEDTAYYTYSRFLPLNEVGGSPDRFGTSIEAFHAQNEARLRHWPRAMTTTTTHDTKRSEDVRARLSVLTEMPHVFESWVKDWLILTEPFLIATEEDDHELMRMPSDADRYVFFQTVLGVYPLTVSVEERPRFEERIVNVMLKSAREAKVHTSWLAPNEAYEASLRAFCGRALKDDAFVSSLQSAVECIAPHGASNSLAQVLLKVASPGIPDTYQGSECWDFRLVDPDNRGPVDHKTLADMLAAIEGRRPEELLASYRDGRVKLYVLSRALRLRRGRPRVFLEGAYLPIDAGEEIVGFVRSHDEVQIACAVTRYPVRVTRGLARFACGSVWGDRRVPIPKGTWRDVLDSGRELTSGPEGIFAADLFRSLPVALLIRERGAAVAR
jgi:(1->4)-alpha-D-glucan 1-alpha-D-glucosylmutase